MNVDSLLVQTETRLQSQGSRGTNKRIYKAGVSLLALLEKIN